MSGARLTRPFRLMKRSGVTECPVMRDVCMVNRPVAAFRTGKMQKNEEATRAAISHRKRAAREGHGSWQPTSRSDFSCSKILSASYFRVGLSPPVIVGARIFQRGKRGMSFFVSSPTTRSSSSLFVAAQSFCHGRRNLKASGQIGDLLASADGWLLCQHPARPLANFRRLCVFFFEYLFGTCNQKNVDGRFA